MSKPRAVIRAYEADDFKMVKFVVGKAEMEGLAAANHKVYMQPITIAVWVAVSSIMIQLMGWWPTPEYGWMGYLRPLPAFAAWVPPILFAVDWIHRPQFEDVTQRVLTYPDLVDIKKYYSLSPASGLWILELGGALVGLIAIDASLHASKRERGTDFTPANFKKGTSTTAFIRHIYVEEPFRVAFAQQDLLDHAIKATFSASPTVTAVEAESVEVLPYVSDGLKACGFTKGETTVGAPIGLLKWKRHGWTLSRKKWEAE